MNKIQEILNNENVFLSSRYRKEALKLAMLANYALNKEKNVSKGDFEGVSLGCIFELLLKEVSELGVEVNRQEIKYESMLDEIGDCAAFLTGMYAKIKSLLSESTTTT